MFAVSAMNLCIYPILSYPILSYPILSYPYVSDRHKGCNCQVRSADHSRRCCQSSVKTVSAGNPKLACTPWLYYLLSNPAEVCSTRAARTRHSLLLCHLSCMWRWEFPLCALLASLGLVALSVLLPTAPRKHPATQLWPL